MSMRIAPASNHSTTHSHLATASTGAPSAPGLHDTLRAGVGPKTSTTDSPLPSSAHPLETRLLHWESTQETLKMTSLRRTFGLSEPIRRGMELKIVSEGTWRPQCLGGGSERGVHEDILRGTDTGCQWEDVYKGDGILGGEGMGVQEEIERKVRML